MSLLTNCIQGILDKPLKAWTSKCLFIPRIKSIELIQLLFYDQFVFRIASSRTRFVFDNLNCSDLSCFNSAPATTIIITLSRRQIVRNGTRSTTVLIEISCNTRCNNVGKFKGTAIQGRFEDFVKGVGIIPEKNIFQKETGASMFIRY